MTQTSFLVQSIPTHFDLRDYQLKALSDVETAFMSLNRVILTLPTGAGKTVVASEKIRRFVSQFKRVLFLAHRRELVFQCSDKLKSFGVDHGIIMAGEGKSFMPDVQVASIQTLMSRIRNPKYRKPDADLIIIDEAHHAIAKSYIDLINHYPYAKILGLTATPVRGDGRGLGELFQKIVEGPTIAELTDQGHLVPCEYYAPVEPDLKGVKTIAGDYAQDQLAEVMDKATLIGDIVENWARICPDRQTVVFASSVAHSLHIRDAFRNAGVNAEHVDGETPKSERDKILSSLKSGDIRLVTNCMVLTEGWDCQITACCVLARPTKSISLYLQMAGRILRPYAGKTNAIIIDHSGAVKRHGFIDDPKEWSLDGNSKIQDRIAKAKKEQGEPGFRTCPECHCVYQKKDRCPSCGWCPPKKAENVEVIDGILGKIERNGKIVKVPMVQPERAIAELSWIQQIRGYKKGWVGYNFKEIFGKWPSNVDCVPVEPSTEMLAWVNKKLKTYRRK